MKFSDGFWLNQRGYEVDYAVQAYEVTTTDHSITLLVTPQTIYNRAMTLGGVTLEITYSSTQENVIRVSIQHFKGVLHNEPKFELHADQGYTPKITNEQDHAELISGDTVLRISKGQNWDVSYTYKGKRLTGGAWRSTSYIQENQFRAENRCHAKCDDTFWSDPADPRSTYIREQLTLSVGECIYGFGEKFTTFVKNGQTVDIWNADGGTCSEQSYKSIPFYISSRGYGVFVNSPDRISYEVASDTVSKVSITKPGEFLEYFLIGGENLQQVLSNYTTLTGKPALPPANTFGLWLSTSFTTTYDEETVTSFIDGMAQRDIPLQMFHFDCFWMKEYEWTSFRWDTTQFPDPPAMLKRLKDRGLGICVWINPYIAQRSCLFDEGVEKGYFIKNPDGSVFQTDMWQPGMAIVDFTNPAACDWFAAGIRSLCEMGVTAIKTDFGERIPTDVAYYDGSDPELMHNYYTHLYNKCVFQLLEEYKGKGQACLFARSATVGGQRFPVHWGGDCSSNYLSMSESLRGGLSLCMSGFGFWSHDISGFEGTAPDDVYKRWAAFGLLSTHSRLHGSNSYRVPWLFGEEAVDVLRRFTNLKCTLMPYLYSAAVEAHQTGVPAMRAMLLEFPQDIPCQDLDRQYMLGERLLVAPVFTKEGDVDYYLPAGTWTNLLDNRVVEGGRWLHEVHGFMSLPLMARENSLIPVGCNDQEVEYDYGKDLTLHLFALKDRASADVKDMYGNHMLKACAKNENGKVTMKFEGKAEGLKVLLRNVKGVKALNGAEAAETELGTLLHVNAGLSDVTFEM